MIEPLESRIAPATFTGAGPNLTIDLNALDELATFSTSGDTVIVNLTNGTANTAGAGGNVTGDGTASATFSSLVYTGTITITDSAAGTAVTFGGIGDYPQSFGITLNDAASGDITFTGDSLFSAPFTAATTAGTISSTPTSVLRLSGAGSNLSLNAALHDILLKGRLVVDGTTSFTSDVLQADNAANDFVGSLTIAGTPFVGAINDVNSLDLAGAALGFGSLDQTTRITAGGNITQSGTFTTTGTGTLAITSSGGSIDLPNAANALSANTALSLSVTAGNAATFRTNGALQLGDTTLGTGILTLTAAGNMSQRAGTAIDTGGAVALAIDGATNRNITLNAVENEIAGAVTITELVAGNIQDVILRNRADNATAPTGTALTTAGDVRNLTLFFENNGVALPGYNITGALNVTAGGDITQTAAQTIAGTSTFTMLGDHAIDLTSPANAFTGAVGFNTQQSTQSVQIVDTAGLSIGASNLGRGAFSATAVTGDIIQSGAIAQEKGAAPATFTVTAGTTITLFNGSNRLTGDLVFAGAGLTGVSVRNVDFMAGFSDLTLPSSVTTLSVRFDNASIALPSLGSVGTPLTSLTVVGAGIVQQPGSSIHATGAAFNALAFPLNLSNAGNDFTNLEIDNTGRNDVAVNDVDDVNFTGTSALGSGRLTINAGDAITNSGIITQAALGTGLSGDVTLNSTGGSITLDGNNAFRGPVSVRVTGANTARVENFGATLHLGNVTTGTGSFDAIANSSDGIFQVPTSVLNMGGVAAFSAGSDAIVLTNRTNTIAGAITLVGSDAAIRMAGSVVLGISNVTGTLSVTSGGTAADSITQTGFLDSGDEAIFDAGAGSVILTNAANDFAAVSVFSTGASVSLTDVNAMNLGTIRVGGGTLSLTAGSNLGLVAGGNGIVQTTGTGVITLDTPAANNISLLSGASILRGSVNVLHSTNVALQSQAGLTFAAGSAVSGLLQAISGGAVTLPTSLNVTGLIVSAASTTIGADITAGASGISLTGAVSFAGDRVLTSGGTISVEGDVNVGGSLTLNLPSSGVVSLNEGTWNQGANPLTINGAGATFSIGNNDDTLARFVMSSGTIDMPGGGDVSVENDGTFQVGTTSSAETVTLANGAGDLRINGTFTVGLGATNDQLIKTGSGIIELLNESTFGSSGLAGATASPVLVSQTALIDGRFPGTVDATDAPRDFFAGSDIVTPAYDFTQLTLKAGGTLAPTGTISGFLPDGDQYTVTSSLGAVAGLAVVEDLAGRLDVVVRNNTAAASKLTISTTGGGDGQLPIGGLMVHAPGAVSVTAPAANFTGTFTTAGSLKALTARDLGAAGESLVMSVGGAASDSTSITARVVQETTATLAGVLDSFKAVSVPAGVSLAAQKFGSITTTGALLGTSLNVPEPDPGDFSAKLTSTTPATGVVLGTATIAGTLSGTWDLRGSVGKVTAFETTGWALGTHAGANIRNGGLLTDAKTLTLGPVTDSSINASGAIGTLTTSGIGISNFTAGSFGAVKVIANLARGLAGNVIDSDFEAMGNSGGVALKSLSIAGDLTLSSLTLHDGDAKAIVVAGTVSETDISATATNGHGNLPAITAGKWDATDIDARTIGTVKIVGNVAGGLFGDFMSSTMTIRGNVAGIALKTFEAQGAVTSSVFELQNGDLKTFKVGRELGSTSVHLTDAAFGNLAVIQAGDWTGGVSVLAKTIGTVASVGAAAAGPASPLLLGGITSGTITAYLDSGIVAAIGKLNVKGDISSGTVNAEHGIASAVIGRAVLSSVLVADDALAGASNVGRIAALTAGAWAVSNVSVNTFGAVKITGYSLPENNSAGFQPGDVIAGSFLAHGGTPTKPTGIESFSIAGNLQSNSTVVAPFGIKTLTVRGSVAVSQIIADNPATPAAGFFTSITVGDLATSTIRGGNIGTLKTTGNALAGLLGNIASSTIAVTSGSTSPGGPQAIGALTVAGDFSNSVLDAPAIVGKIDVLGAITTSGGATRIQAGYAAGGKLGSLSAAAWGVAGVVTTIDLVSQSVGTFTLKGNAARGIAGTVDRGFFDLLGNSAGIGVGTFSAAGTVSDSLFRVSDGDVSSFTAQRLVSSDLLVGFRFVKASDITQAPTAAFWSATNHMIGIFKTTAAFDATDVSDSASFVDSNVIAGILGSITISGVNPATLDSTAFGVAFRTSGGAAGVVKINGSAVALAPGASSGQFNYLGLAG